MSKVKSNLAIANQKTDDLETQFKIADEFVSKRYLSNLEQADIIKFDSSNYPDLAGMSWFKITKLVYECGVFFPDQISTLYSALHDESRQLALVIQKKQGNVNLYIGIRDKDGEGYFHSKTLLERGFHGIFPGAQLEQQKEFRIEKPTNKLPNKQGLAISTVSGIASLRNDDNQTFIQGLERVINATVTVDNFTIAVIADSVGNTEANNVIKGYKSLYTELKPLANVQRTYSFSLSQSESNTISKGFSKILNTSIGRTITNGSSTMNTHTHTEGFSHTEEKTHSDTVGGMIGGAVGPVAIIGNYAHTWNRGHADSSQNSNADSNAFGEQHLEADSKTETRGETKEVIEARALAEAKSETSSTQVSIENKHISYMVGILERQIHRLEESVPYGLWNCCTYFIADTTTTTKNLANIYRGVLIGKESGVQVMAVNTWSQESLISSEMLQYIQRALNPLFLYDGFKVTAGSIVTSRELSIHMSLPQTSVPGLLVREQATFGRNVQRKDSNNMNLRPSLILGKIYHLDKKEALDVGLNLDDLVKHTFVTGSTGSGKSNAIYKILNSLPTEINYLVIEPAKGEYRHFLNHSNREIETFTCERKGQSLLRLNPFKFPKEIDIYEHIGKLVEIFNVCWPMYAAMPAVLKDSIIRAYVSCGWNLKDSTNVFNLYPNFKDVLYELRNVARFSEYSSDTKADYLGSLETRITSLTNGINGEIFVDSNDIGDKDLFDSRAIIDLNCLDTDSRSLVMGVLTLKLYEYRKSQSKIGSPNRKLHHVTVLEEAHNILPRTSKLQMLESANIVGKSVEMISNAIAEMRTYGEGFIIVDQSPTSVDEASIKNTNTKIVMSLPDGDDRYIIGKSMGLKDIQIDEISMLPTGVGVIFQNNWTAAVLCKIDKVPVQEYYAKAKKKVVTNNKDMSDSLIELLKLYYAKSYNNNTPATLVSLLSDCHVRSSLKYDILTSHDIIFDTDKIQNFCAFACVDVIGMNAAKAVKHYNDVRTYTSHLTPLIQKELGFPISQCNLLDLTDMYVRGICVMENNYKEYQKWKEEAHGI